MPASAAGRRALTYLAPALAVLAGVVLLLHARDRAAIRSLLTARAAHTAELAAARLSRELTVPVGDVRTLSGQAALALFLAGDEGARGALEDGWAQFLRIRGAYHRIALLGLDGTVLAEVGHRGRGPEARPTTGAAADPADPADLAGARGLPRGEVWVSPLTLHRQGGAVEAPWRPVVRFVTPAFDRDGTRRGAVALTWLAAPALGEIEELWASDAGDAWLVDTAGQYLLGAPMERRFARVFGRDAPGLPSDRPAAWARLAASNATAGTFEEGGAWYTWRAVESPPMRVVAAFSGGTVDAEAVRGLLPLVGVSTAAAVLLAVLAFWVGRAEEGRRAHAGRLAVSERRLHALSMRLLDAQDRERRRLAQDLHDGLGQVVTALTLHLRRAARTDDADKRAALLSRAQEAADRVLADVRAIAGSVRPAFLDDLGLEEAVRGLVDDFGRASGLDVELVVALQGAAPTPEVGENLYRILQEALTNAWRHAGTATVAVRVEADPGSGVLRATVRDAGRGFAPAQQQPGSAGAAGDAAPPPHLGLLGMRERAELVGGALHIVSAPGEGTEVVVEVPLPREARG